MIRFIDVMKDRFGVELVCRTMRAAEMGFLTARGYRAAKSRPASARTLSDQLIGGEIVRLHAENSGVYGVRKMHRLLRRQGWEIGRDQTGRIMRSLGLRGVRRSKRVFTTTSDPADARPTDLVQRHFRAATPRRHTAPTLGRRRHLCAHRLDSSGRRNTSDEELGCRRGNMRSGSGSRSWS